MQGPYWLYRYDCPQISSKMHRPGVTEFSTGKAAFLLHKAGALFIFSCRDSQYEGRIVPNRTGGERTMKRIVALFFVVMIIPAIGAPQQLASMGSAPEPIPFISIAESGGEGHNMTPTSIIFATYAADSEAMYWSLVMVESIREFGGALRHAPIWVYQPAGSPALDSAMRSKQAALAVDIKLCAMPDEAKVFWFAGKVFASAVAETEAEKKGRILAWLDPDVVFVKEPTDFFLADSIAFGYRPVLHKLIGSLYAEPPDEFWLRVYEKLAVPESALFPVVTPVDELTLWAYFNAGILIVRPERGLLRTWPGCFQTLYRDSVFAQWCRKDQLRAIFLHQAALAGAILTHLKRNEMVELPATYNYPLYFHSRYPGATRPASLDDVVMFRHEFFSREFQDVAGEELDRSKIMGWVRARIPKK